MIFSIYLESLTLPVVNALLQEGSWKRELRVEMSVFLFSRVFGRSELNAVRDPHYPGLHALCSVPHLVFIRLRLWLFYE